VLVGGGFPCRDAYGARGGKTKSCASYSIPLIIRWRGWESEGLFPILGAANQRKEVRQGRRNHREVKCGCSVGGIVLRMSLSLVWCR